MGHLRLLSLRSGACKSLQCCITATSGPRVQYSVCMHIQNCETSQAPLPLEPRCCGQCPLNMWSNRRLWVQSHLVLVLVVLVVLVSERTGIKTQKLKLLFDDYFENPVVDRIGRFSGQDLACGPPVDNHGCRLWLW